MSIGFEFTLSDSDFQKLRLLKRADDRSEITLYDYAEVLLGGTVRRMYREYVRDGRIKEAEDD